MRFEIFATKPNRVADIVRMTSDVLSSLRSWPRRNSRRAEEPDRRLHAQVGVADVIEHVDHHDQIEALGREDAVLDRMVVDLDTPGRVGLGEPASSERDVGLDQRITADDAPWRRPARTNRVFV